MVKYINDKISQFFEFLFENKSPWPLITFISVLIALLVSVPIFLGHMNYVRYNSRCIELEGETHSDAGTFICVKKSSLIHIEH